MSRVAKAPVVQPANVEITIGDGEVTVKGPKGTLTQKINRLVKVTKIMILIMLSLLLLQMILELGLRLEQLVH